MSRGKVLVLDQPYHAQTRSSDFLVELLSTRFDVAVDYLKTHPRNVGASVDQVRSHNPDLLVLFQTALRARALVQLGIPTTWIPMFDQSRRPWHQNYLEAALAGINVLAFSSVVGRFARSWNLPSMDVRYYPPVGAESATSHDFSQVLLWYRGFIQPSEVWPTLREIEGLKVVLKNDIDPSSSASTRIDGEIGPAIDRIVEGFLPKDEYNDLVNRCGVFVAPRRKEGIGLSFLEAMARGACVVAYDAPTMNEYIVHGKTGWLFSERGSEPIPQSQVATIGQAAREQVIAGRTEWEGQQASVLDFIASAPTPTPQHGAKLLVAAPVAGAISALTPLKHRLFGA